MASMYGNCITRFREKSRDTRKPQIPKDLHPLLVGDFVPDVRPFTWPKRKRKKTVALAVQLELFDDWENL